MEGACVEMVMIKVLVRVSPHDHSAEDRRQATGEHKKCRSLAV